MIDSTIGTQIDWEKVEGLVPVVVQNHQNGKVLMLGYMNQEALKQTLETKLVTFYSRTKKRLWVKGEVSQNTLGLVGLSLDCDQDTLLALVEPAGPTCHLGTETCFGQDFQSNLAMIEHLEAVIKQRQEQKPEGSYVTSLFDSGLARIAQKVGEEAVESVIAAMKMDDEELKNEMADLLFHMLILLREKQMSVKDILGVLEKRVG